MRRVLRVVVASAFAGAVSLTGVGHDRAAAADRAAMEEVRALLAEGRAAEALEKAKAALVHAADDPEAFGLASDAAAAAKCADEALLFAHAARAAALRARRADIARTFAAKAVTLEPAELGAKAPLEEATQSLLDAARMCVKKRYWVTALQGLSRLESTALGEHAEAELAKLYANKSAVTALLDSKIAVPRTLTQRKERAKAAEDDAKHATWDTALVIETANYTVRTDAGHDVAQSVATAMEPMNAFYRRVFRVDAARKPAAQKPKERKKTAEVAPPKCTVRVFRSRAEMRETTRYDRDVLGFYSPRDNSVTVFDPRSEGRPLASLWPTLFHEASHQFTALISNEHVPSWLNEGTASYFEGAVLRADGRVDTNLVPDYRLAGCVDALRTGTPTLREVVSYSELESYPAEYYPVGWGLVYFLRNYTDERLEKVYEKPYGDLMDSYCTPGGTAPLARFVEYIVTRPKQAGVDTFEAFEERFRAWIQELDYFHGGPSQAARDFTERAGKHVAAGRRDDAEEDYRLALTKNADYLPALTGLGDLLATLRRNDEAITCFRRAAEAVRRDPNAAGFGPLDVEAGEQAARDALARVAKIDPQIAQALSALDADLEARTRAQAEKYVELSMPRNALRVLDSALVLLSGSSELESLRRTIAQDAAVDVLLPRPLDLRPGAERVWASDGWKVEGSRIVAPRARASLLRLAAGRGARDRVEGTVRVANPDDVWFAGLVVGADAEGEWEAVGLGGGTVEVSRVLHDWKHVSSPRALTPEEAKSFHLAIEVRPRLMRVHVNGELVASEEFGAGALRGGIGLLVLDGSAEFDDVRLEE